MGSTEAPSIGTPFSSTTNTSAENIDNEELLADVDKTTLNMMKRLIFVIVFIFG